MESHFPHLADTRHYQARERVLADLKMLARDVEALLKVTAGNVSDQARAARERVRATLERAKSSYLEIQAKGIESTVVAARKTDATIRAYPYHSLGIALGVGIVLGAAVRRK